jgi:hypothetical protein
MAMLNNFIDHKDGYARADHVVNIAQNGSGRSANDSAGSSRQRLCWRARSYGDVVRRFSYTSKVRD